MKENWDKATNFIPLPGEIIVYDDLRKIKIGDGVTLINDLPFFLENVVYSDETDVEVTTVPINADTLGGRNADEYATNEKVDALTYNDVGAAPAGFGLGTGAVTTTMDKIDGLLANGWYYTSSSTGYYIGSVPIYFILLRVDSWKDTAGNRVVKHTLFDDGSEITRYWREGTWYEWECVNPPMNFGQEYRTTERWMGKPVYVQVLDFGSLPDKTSKNKTITITGATAVPQIVKIDGVFTDGNTTQGDVFGMKDVVGHYANCYQNHIEFGIETDRDSTAYSAIITFKYTKN